MMNVVHLWYNSVITLLSKILLEENLLFHPELNVQMTLYVTLNTSFTTLILVNIYFVKFFQYSYLILHVQ